MQPTRLFGCIASFLLLLSSTESRIIGGSQDSLVRQPPATTSDNVRLDIHGIQQADDKVIAALTNSLVETYNQYYSYHDSYSYALDHLSTQTWSLIPSHDGSDGSADDAHRTLVMFIAVDATLVPPSSSTTTNKFKKEQHISMEQSWCKTVRSLEGLETATDCTMHFLSLPGPAHVSWPAAPTTTEAQVYLEVPDGVIHDHDTSLLSKTLIETFDDTFHAAGLALSSVETTKNQTLPGLTLGHDASWCATGFCPTRNTENGDTSLVVHTLSVVPVSWMKPHCSTCTPVDLVELQRTFEEKLCAELGKYASFVPVAGCSFRFTYGPSFGDETSQGLSSTTA